MVNFSTTSTSSWKPRKLPVIRRYSKVLRNNEHKYRAFIDPNTNAAKYYDTLVPTVFYDEPPSHVTVEWLSKPPPGSVVYADTDSDVDDDPFGLFDFENNARATKVARELESKQIEALQSNKTTAEATAETTADATTEATADATTVATPLTSKYAHTLAIDAPTTTTVETKSASTKIFQRKSWHQRASSVVALGPDWEKHLWTPPDKIKARDAGQRSIYKNGLGDLLAPLEKEEIGMEIYLFFHVLKQLACTFFLMSIVVLPVVLTYAKGKKHNFVTPASLGISENIAQHCQDLYALDPLDPPSLNCSSALGGNGVDFIGVAMTMQEFTVVVSMLDTLAIVVFVGGTLKMLASLKKSMVEAENEIRIESYAVSVSGFPATTTKLEIIEFFSQNFNPNLSGPLYDDGNRIVEKDLHIEQDEENKRKQKKDNTKEQEMAMDHHKQHQAELEKEQQMAKSANNNTRKRTMVDGYQWHSQRRIIHHDGSDYQKQVFFPVTNNHNTNDIAYQGKFVCEVTLAFKNDASTIRRYMRRQKLVTKLHATRAMVQYFQLHSTSTKNQKEMEAHKHNLIMLEQELKKIKDEVKHEDLIGDSDRTQREAHCAFVVFNHETSYMRAVEAYRTSNVPCCRCRQKEKLKIGGMPIRVRPASNPTNIIYENIGKSIELREQCKEYGFIFFLLCVSFACATIPVFEVAAAMIVVFHFILQTCLTKIKPGFGGHATKTQRQASIMFTYFLVGFINNGILYVLAQYRSSFYEKTAVAIIAIQFCINIVGPHLSLFSKTLHQLRVTFNRQVTQEIANKQQTGPEFNVPLRLASVMNTIACTLTYSSCLPVLLPMATSAFFIAYWVDKYLILTYYKRTGPATRSSTSRDQHALFFNYIQTVPFIVVLLHFAVATWVYSDLTIYYSNRVVSQMYQSLNSFLFEALRQRVMRAGALASWVALLLLLLLWFVNIATKTVSDCIGFACCCCGHTDHHEDNFHARREQQSGGNKVQYLNDSDREEEEAHKYRNHQNRWWCCIRVAKSFSLKHRFRSLPPLTDNCIMTLRDTKGTPLRMPPDFKLDDLSVDDYLSKAQQEDGWRLGVEPRRQLLYRNKVWGFPGNNFGRIHSFMSKQRTYELMLQNRQPYTYNIHGLKFYQHILRAQYSSKKSQAKEAQVKRRKSIKNNAPLDIDVDWTIDIMKKMSSLGECAEMPHDLKEELPRWVRLFDSQHTSYYYYDQFTGDSVWDEPIGFIANKTHYAVRWLLSEKPRSALVIQTEFRKHLAKKVYQARYEREREQDKGMHVDHSTGEKWRIRENEKGEEYYQHDSHGAKQYEKPADFRSYGQEDSHMHKVELMLKQLKLPVKEEGE